ncbi:hypothetical protein VTL71DRAFT_9649 [Oculimacula yallundae]|uniref:F-box domain-containing protein n=1 Tax=Oculimacula yallundae TaxID=86028 RepID=A0ABR4BRG7_9HELO
MGYSEVSCQICAVRFNVARLRTRDEPVEAGWGFSSSLHYAGDPTSAICSLHPEQSGCDEDVRGEPDDDVLHFPGRYCTYEGGYNGWKIGADEMKGMRLPRYIVQKPANRDDSDEDQEEYERSSDFFVTSQTTRVPFDADFGGPLAKVRFEVDFLFPQNYLVMKPTDGFNCGVPVHDQCWKIFERVSKLRMGKVDLQGFMALWDRQACSGCGFEGINSEPMLPKCKSDHWQHLPGSEYLAANPLDIPGLMIQLYSFYLTQPSGISMLSERPPHRDNAMDKFGRLPKELTMMILQHLSSKDIASLRLVTRSFRYLPKKAFLGLIKKELPWFWEYDEFEEFMQKTHNGYQKLWDRDLGESNPINWYVLYNQLRLAKTKLLGLKNRVRIWNVAEEITRRIQKLRDEIGEGEDLPVGITEDEKERGVKQPGFSCIKCDYTLRPKMVNY